MKTATVTITGLTRLQFGRYHQTEKLDKENNDDYESRCWREKAHYDERTRQLYLPPQALKNAIVSTAKVMQLAIPGKGKSLYTKHFLMGTLCVDPALLRDAETGAPLTVDDCIKVPVFGNSKGQRLGDGPRVMKYFPTLKPGWATDLVYHILDDTITKSVAEKVIAEIGNFNGFGVFRPQSGGHYGRFEIKKITWEG